jgi:membrane associated rhomboid family serine protease
MNGRFELRKESAVAIFLIANVVLYLVELLPGIGGVFLRWGGLIPVVTFMKGQLWRLVGYMFLHDPQSPFHLLFNMLALWMFGVEIEQMWGKKRFIRFYLLAGIGSGCFSIIHLFSPLMKQVPVIGASGAVLAILTVYAVYFPHRQVLLFFVLPVNIRVVVIGYALLSLFGSLRPHGVISHITHLGGILVAIAYLRWYPRVSGWLQLHITLRNERQMRQRAESAAKERRYFEEKIDPILDKISREGKDALSAEERRILEKAATSKNKEYFKKKKIIPFDLFK